MPSATEELRALIARHDEAKAEIVRKQQQIQPNTEGGLGTGLLEALGILNVIPNLIDVGANTVAAGATALGIGGTNVNTPSEYLSDALAALARSGTIALRALPGDPFVEMGERAVSDISDRGAMAARARVREEIENNRDRFDDPDAALRGAAPVLGRKGPDGYQLTAEGIFSGLQQQLENKRLPRWLSNTIAGLASGSYMSAYLAADPTLVAGTGAKALQAGEKVASAVPVAARNVARSRVIAARKLGEYTAQELASVSDDALRAQIAAATSPEEAAKVMDEISLAARDVAAGAVGADRAGNAAKLEQLIAEATPEGSVAAENLATAQKLKLKTGAKAITPGRTFLEQSKLGQRSLAPTWMRKNPKLAPLVEAVDGAFYSSLTAANTGLTRGAAPIFRAASDTAERARLGLDANAASEAITAVKANLSKLANLADSSTVTRLATKALQWPLKHPALGGAGIGATAGAIDANEGERIGGGLLGGTIGLGIGIGGAQLFEYGSRMKLAQRVGDALGTKLGTDAATNIVRDIQLQQDSFRASAGYAAEQQQPRIKRMIEAMKEVPKDELEDVQRRIREAVETPGAGVAGDEYDQLVVMQAAEMKDGYKFWLDWQKSHGVDARSLDADYEYFGRTLSDEMVDHLVNTQGAREAYQAAKKKSYEVGGSHLEERKLKDVSFDEADQILRDELKKQGIEVEHVYETDPIKQLRTHGRQAQEAVVQARQVHAFAETFTTEQSRKLGTELGRSVTKTLDDTLKTARSADHPGTHPDSETVMNREITEGLRRTGKTQEEAQAVIGRWEALAPRTRALINRTLPKTPAATQPDEYFAEIQAELEDVHAAVAGMEKVGGVAPGTAFPSAPTPPPVVSAEQSAQDAMASLEKLGRALEARGAVDDLDVVNEAIARVRATGGDRTTIQSALDDGLKAAKNISDSKQTAAYVNTKLEDEAIADLTKAGYADLDAAKTDAQFVKDLGDDAVSGLRTPKTKTPQPKGSDPNDPLFESFTKLKAQLETEKANRVEALKVLEAQPKVKKKLLQPEPEDAKNIEKLRGEVARLSKHIDALDVKLVKKAMQGGIADTDTLIAQLPKDTKAALVRAHATAAPEGTVSALDMLSEPELRHALPNDVESMAQLANVHIPEAEFRAYKDLFSELRSSKKGKFFDNLNRNVKAFQLATPGGAFGDFIGNQLTLYTIGGGWRDPNAFWRAGAAWLIAHPDEAQRLQKVIEATPLLKREFEAAKRVYRSVHGDRSTVDVVRDLERAGNISDKRRSFRENPNPLAPEPKTLQELLAAAKESVPTKTTVTTTALGATAGAMSDDENPVRSGIVGGLLGAAGGLTAQAAGRTLLSGAAAKAGDAALAIRELQDDWHRIAAADMAMRDGRSLQDSIRHSKNLFFDYGELTKFEKAYAKRAILYYNFVRKSIPLIMRQAFEKPITLKLLMLISGTQNDPDAPGWAQRTFGHYLGKDKAGSRVMVSFGQNLMQPMMKLLEAENIAEFGQNLASVSSPIPKTLGELAFDTDSFSGKRIGSRDNIAQLDKAGNIANRAPSWLRYLPPPIRNALGFETKRTTEGQIRGYTMDPRLRWVFEGVLPLGPLSRTAENVLGSDERKPYGQQALGLVGVRSRSVPEARPEEADVRRIRAAKDAFENELYWTKGRPWMIRNGNLVPNPNTEAGQALAKTVERATKVAESEAKRRKVPQGIRGRWVKAQVNHALSSINPQLGATREAWERLRVADKVMTARRQGKRMEMAEALREDDEGEPQTLQQLLARVG